MTQKHVELLLKAIAVPESYSQFLCDRIGFVSGYYNGHPELFQEGYEDARDALCGMIKENIEHEFSFEDTFYARGGMTREEWVKEILVPLALQLP